MKAKEINGTYKVHKNDTWTCSFLVNGRRINCVGNVYTRDGDDWQPVAPNVTLTNEERAAIQRCIDGE